jgi:hypothetical protein
LEGIKLATINKERSSERVTYTANAEVLVVDEDLVLQCSSEGTDDERVAPEAATKGAGPAQVRWAGVDKAERVVASVEEVLGNGIGWEPANPGVLQCAGDTVNVNLKRLFADLKAMLVIHQKKLLGLTNSVQRSVVINEEGGELGVVELVVWGSNKVAALQPDGISVEGTGGRELR